MHIKTPDHGLDSSFEKGLFLTFPSFKTQATVGLDDIYLDMTPCTNESTSNISITMSSDLGSVYCRDITQKDQLSVDDIPLDNILKELRRYYHDVKTQRQLGLPVPSGFRPQSTYQRQIVIHTPPRKSAKGIGVTESMVPLLENDTTDDLPSTPVHSNKSSDILESSVCANTDSSDIPPFIPIIRSVDKPSSSLPNCISMTEI